MENPNFIFSSGPVELKQEKEDFFVEGHISTSDLDLVNDIVTKNCLLDMASQMQERTIKLDIEHESFRGSTDLEKEINKTIIPAAKIDDFSIDKKGLKIRAMLNRHVSRFNEVKNSIKDGFLDAFSIAFIPVESKTEMRDGQEVRMLNKIRLLNVAFTGNPVNTSSTMTNVFAKSLEFLEEKGKPKKPTPQPDPHKEPEEDEDEEEKKKKEKKNHNHSKDDIIKLQEVKKMTEEENKEEKPSESEEKPEEKTEEAPKEEKKDEEPEEKEEESEEESKESTTEEEVKTLKKEMMEVKAVLKRPLLKSKVEQQDKANEFAEEKSLNPLDVIA